MARTLGWFYVAGATLGGLSLVLPHSRGTDVVGVLAVVAIALVGGVLLMVGSNVRRRRRFPVPGGRLTADQRGRLLRRHHQQRLRLLLRLGRGRGVLLPQPSPRYPPGAPGRRGVHLGAQPRPSDGLAEQRWLLTIGTAMVAGLLVAYQHDRIGALVHRLTDAARTDPLTGLLNRRGFEETFKTELERARRNGRPLTVVAGDLDGFKLVNDQHGHHAGDEALQALAADLLKWKRRIDVAARLGGEEFALLLPDTDERGAFLVAERLRRAVQRTFSEQPLPVTISFGVATWPDHGQETETLLRAADEALYAAKDLGRDRTVIYSAAVAAVLADGRGTERGEMQLATVVSLAEALDIRDTGTARHSQTVGRYAADDGRRAGPAAAACRAHPRGGRASRRRQDRDLRPGADQARPARRGRVGGTAHPSRDRRPAARSARVRRPLRLDRRAPRAARRHGLSGRSAWGGDPPRGAHPGRGRRLRGDDRRPGLQKS